MLLTRIHMLSAFLCGRTSKQHIHYSFVWEGAGRLAASPLHASACQGTVNVSLGVQRDVRALEIARDDAVLAHHRLACRCAQV